MTSISPLFPWLTTESFSKEDGITFLCLCIFNALYFNIAKKFVPNTEKAKGWLITLLGSFFLSFVGTAYVFDACSKFGLFWTTSYIHGEDQITRVAVLFFCSINVMDLVLGSIFYKSQLDPLSGWFHHFVYLIFVFCLLAHHYARGFALCMFMELPTFVLALGSIAPSCRADLLFGILFFITRIAYNIYYIIRLATLHPEGLIWRICSATLCLHLFWFYKWALGYLKKRTPKVEKLS